MNKLTSKVAVVTGASKGMGAVMARHLAGEGASVVVHYSSADARWITGETIIVSVGE